MEKSTFTRQELYDLVWSESILQLSKKLNISEGGLRRICIWMNIPTPKQGYWAKIHYGYKVEKEKLPLEFNEKSEVIVKRIVLIK